MAGHTIMPPRIQKTPHGDVTLTSRWMRNHYVLLATGPELALRWMFPASQTAFESVSPVARRHAFVPAPYLITVERELRAVCHQWQDRWDQALADHQQGFHPVADAPPRSLGELIDRYQAARAGELAPATLERNRHYLGRWRSALGGQQVIADLTQDHLLTARLALARELEATTVNCMFALLRSTLRWAADRGWMTATCYQGIRELRETRNPHDKAWWTSDEVEIALRCAGEVDGELHAGDVGPAVGTATLLIALGCLLGLRYEEIVMLRWLDVDLDSVDARTATPAPVAHIVPKEGWRPKDGEARSVPVPERLRVILVQYRRKEGYILQPAKAMPKRGGSKRVYRYDPKKVWLRVVAKVVQAGVKSITPNGMRHSFASNLLMAGVSDVLVARWLGHADTSMVHERYGHLLAYHGDINKVTSSKVAS